MGKFKNIVHALKCCVTNGNFALFIFGVSFTINTFGQQELDKKTDAIALELKEKILLTKKQRIAIIEFESVVDNKNVQTQLGVFLADEISASLSNLTENQTKFSMLDRHNLDQILEEKKILKTFDRTKLAKDLGKIDATEILISAKITEYNGQYKVTINLLDTKDGHSLGSVKTYFSQEKSLMDLQKGIIATSNTNNQIESRLKTTIEQEQQKSEVKESVYAPLITEACFNNVSNNYNAILTIKNSSSGEKVKSVDVLQGQKACVYNIKSGVYQIEVSWYHRYGGNKNNPYQIHTREINIKNGSENLFELKL